MFVYALWSPAADPKRLTAIGFLERRMCGEQDLLSFTRRAVMFCGEDVGCCHRQDDQSPFIKRPTQMRGLFGKLLTGAGVVPRWARQIERLRSLTDTGRAMTEAQRIRTTVSSLDILASISKGEVAFLYSSYSA